MLKGSAASVSLVANFPVLCYNHFHFNVGLRREVTDINAAIELFGNHIYKAVKESPEKVCRPLAAVYKAYGLKEKYLPSKKLLPCRHYLAAAASNSVARSFKDTGNKALVNIFLPCEILHAFGIETVFPEAMACYLTAAAGERAFIETAEANGVPESFCSYHKIIIGLAESGVLPKPEFIINTSLACDANQLSFRRIAEDYDVPQYFVDVPNSITESSLKYVTEQLKGMTAFVEEHKGRKIDNEKLKQSVLYSKKTIENYRQYFKLRETRYLSDQMTSEMFSVFATHVMLGTREACEYSEQLVKQVGELPETYKGKRILWVHTLPYWQNSLRNIFNFNERCEIIACDMNFDSLTDMDEEKPYESMAKRLLECTFNGSSERRISKAAEYAEKMHADGIVYFCHWGCKQTLGAAQAAKSYFEKRGFPTLLLDGDGCDSNNINDGQMLTRAEAFLEQIEGKR